MKAAFASAASVRLPNGSRLMNRPDLHRFFGDLELAEPRRRHWADHEKLDKLYDDCIQLQVDFTHVANGLSFWSFKVLLHNALKELGSSWYVLIERTMAPRIQRNEKTTGEEKAHKEYATAALHPYPYPSQAGEAAAKQRDSVSALPLALLPRRADAWASAAPADADALPTDASPCAPGPARGGAGWRI